MAVEITKDFVWQAIPPRPRESHKGTFGTVLAVAGSASYRGAALLAAEGALRTGAGIVTLASVEPVLAAAAARLPECCLCPCAAGADGGISPESIPFIQRQAVPPRPQCCCWARALAVRPRVQPAQQRHAYWYKGFCRALRAVQCWTLMA